MESAKRKSPAPSANGSRASSDCVVGNTNCFEITASDIQFQRACEALHSSGPRPLSELLAECISEFGPEFGDFLRRRLNLYTAIPAEVYRAIGGDRFPAPPLHEVLHE